MSEVRIARAENDLLYGEDGRKYIDMFSAHGATWLGHANQAIAAGIAEQLQKVWLTGGLDGPVCGDARQAVESFFPPSHRLAALYSTGMEAAEFALRIARVATGRNGVIGFEGSMHGKSLATAYLGWDNKDGVRLPFFHRLPFVHSSAEDAILTRCEEALGAHTVSAVFVEPVQASSGGRTASRRFYQKVSRLCREHGALLVFDEILTGFYRTGNPFFYSDLGFVPDIVLIGKAMGNGFPVSGVVVDRSRRIVREMLPGSTYAGNPLACAAVVATLRQMRALDLPGLVGGIQQAILSSLDSLRQPGMALRGRGALWVIELPPALDLESVARAIYGRGVCVGFTGRQLRLLPAATIDPHNLAAACGVICDEILRASHDRKDGR